MFPPKIPTRHTIFHSRRRVTACLTAPQSSRHPDYTDLPRGVIEAFRGVLDRALRASVCAELCGEALAIEGRPAVLIKRTDVARIANLLDHISSADTAQ